MKKIAGMIIKAMSKEDVMDEDEVMVLINNVVKVEVEREVRRALSELHVDPVKCETVEIAEVYEEKKVLELSFQRIKFENMRKRAEDTFYYEKGKGKLCVEELKSLEEEIEKIQDKIDFVNYLDNIVNI